LASLNVIRLRLRRIFTCDKTLLSPLLNFLTIFLDFPFPDSLVKRPPEGWTKSQLSWISFTFFTCINKSASYLSSQEKTNLNLVRYRYNQSPHLSAEPLVTVIIPTYNRAKILLSRSVPSVLNQTYKNIELIVVGDHCIDGTEKLLESYPDSRLRFINLPKRGEYPKTPLLRWLVAGVSPVNVGLKESKGEWIAHLDDDDQFSQNHIKELLNFALQNNFEMVYGKVRNQNSDSSWRELGCPNIELGNICRSASLYRGYLKCFSYDVNAWKKGEPADFNLWRRMKRSNVRMGFLNMVVGLHYEERSRILKNPN
jgi:hypothetical protein